MSKPEALCVPSAAAGRRLDRWLAERFPSRSYGEMQKWLRTGQVRLDGRRAKGGERLEGGEMVRVPPQAETDASRAESRPAKPRRVPQNAEQVWNWVLYQDEEIFVLDKPAGLAVQGGSGTHVHLDGMLDALAGPGAERPRLVHRLDRDTSGVLVVARGARPAARITRLFRDGAIEKLYWAVVAGVPTPHNDVIDAPLAKEGTRGREAMVIKDGVGAAAQTVYSVVQHAGKVAAWLALAPLTGRTHQLRVHCTYLGTPILGDGKYGGREAFLSGLPEARSLHLHARAIRLPLANSQTVVVQAPLPRHMQTTFDALGFVEAEAAAAEIWPVAARRRSVKSK